MPFIPHTSEEIQEMLGAIGVAKIEDLFSEIPAALRTGELKIVPPGMNETRKYNSPASRASW